MSYTTADLSDEFREILKVPYSIFMHYGQKRVFEGRIETVKVYEDNVLVKQQLSTNGEGKVLVVDGGGSDRVALMGDNVAKLALDNDWEGVVIYGCIRDSAEIDEMEIAVRALGTHPFKSIKRGEGEIGISLTFAGVTIDPGEYLYADDDGIIIAPDKLSL